MNKEEVICRNCGNLGYTVEMGHACGGDEKKCPTTCPVEVQVECPCSELPLMPHTY
jgi:hypothetical protein